MTVAYTTAQVRIGTKTNGRVAWLDTVPAASFERMRAAGMPTGGITDAGRTNAEQWDLWRAYLRGELAATAAYPGTSKHETGTALDLTGATLAWVRAWGEPYGWAHDVVRNEPWHVEYRAGLDTHDGVVRVSDPVVDPFDPVNIPPIPDRPDPLTTTDTEEADDMLATVKILYADALGRAGTLEEWVGWLVPGESEADLITRFLGVKPEPGTVRKAYADYLRTSTVDTEGMAFWLGKATIRQVRDGVRYAATHPQG